MSWQYTFFLQCNMQNVISMYHITGNTENNVTYFGNVFVCEVQRQKLRRSGPQVPLTITKCLSARHVSQWYISIKLHSFPERVLDFLTGPTGTMHHRGDQCMVHYKPAQSSRMFSCWCCLAWADTSYMYASQWWRIYGLPSTNRVFHRMSTVALEVTLCDDIEAPMAMWR